jgi:hypothetical protein
LFCLGSLLGHLISISQLVVLNKEKVIIRSFAAISDRKQLARCQLPAGLRPGQVGTASHRLRHRTPGVLGRGAAKKLFSERLVLLPEMARAVFGVGEEHALQACLPCRPHIFFCVIDEQGIACL